jgi:dipeptidyl-peptidase 4
MRFNLPRAGRRPGRGSRWTPCVQAVLLVIGGLATAASAARAAGPARSTDDESRAALLRIVRTRGFTRGLPRTPVPAPDGHHVYFLRSGPEDTEQALYEYDVAMHLARPVVELATLGTEDALSDDERARRERERQTERGVTAFAVSDDGRQVLFPFAGDLFLVDCSRRTPHRLTRTPEHELDAHLSPDGARVACVRGRDLIAIEVAGGRETCVAHSEDPQLSYGAPEFIAQEEMDRDTAHWWAPDSRALAFLSVDSTPVPVYHLPGLENLDGEGSTSRYPRAGAPNAIVRLHLWRTGESSFRTLDLGGDVEYVARVHWLPGSEALVVETQPRGQQRVDVRRVDLSGGPPQILWREQTPGWVDLHRDFRALLRRGEFLWRSSRTGHSHLELMSPDGQIVRTLTSGDWDVTGVTDLDEEHATVTFTGTRDGVNEQHLYRVSLRGGPVEKLSREPGWHDAAFHDRGHEVYVETWSDDRRPPLCRVRDRKGQLLGELPAVAPAPSAAEMGPVALYLHFERAGSEPLEVRFVRPAPRPSGQRIPLVVYVYAGPGSHQVRRAWLGERGGFEAWLVERGFAVARIDGRGTAPRGHRSALLFSGRLGGGELDDQVAGVQALLATDPDLDPGCVGIWGWSYGGFMTLMALARESGTFRAGVAVAPVVDWRDYDCHYSERYLGLPDANPAAYDSSCVLTYAGRLRGHLVLVHGASDDNVHMRGSMQLTHKLIEAGTQFDLMIYPGTHLLDSLEQRMHLYQLIERSFAAHL